MRAFVRFGLEDGEEIELGHGDMIGRLWSATLVIEDPRISEAHALVSLRGDELRLLALRGRFSLGESALSEITLAPGQRIWLTRDRYLDVRAVERPRTVLALQLPGLAPQLLTGTTALHGGSRPRLSPRLDDDAAAVVWCTGETWLARVGDGPNIPLEPGMVFEVAGAPFRVVEVDLATAAPAPTQVAGTVSAPLRIEACFDSVHIHRDGADAVVLSGISARILSELVALDGPVGWEIVGGLIWPDEPDRVSLRRKWDVALARLRARLRDARIRNDLVRAIGTGTVEMLRYPGDEVIDRT
jgi:hypothetical protein